MFYNRVWREGNQVIDITVRDGGQHHVRYILTQRVIRHRNIDNCGTEKETTCYRISIINNKGFVEKWGANLGKFRREIPYGIAENIISKYFGVVRELKSETEEVVEVASMIRLFIEEYEGAKHENQA